MNTSTTPVPSESDSSFAHDAAVEKIATLNPGNHIILCYSTEIVAWRKPVGGCVVRIKVTPVIDGAVQALVLIKADTADWSGSVIEIASAAARGEVGELAGRWLSADFATGYGSRLLPLDPENSAMAR